MNVYRHETPCCLYGQTSALTTRPLACSHCSHAELKDNNNNISIEMKQNEIKWMLHDVLMHIEQQPFDTRKWFAKCLSCTSHEHIIENKKKILKVGEVGLVVREEKNFLFKMYPVSNIILTRTGCRTRKNITNPQHLLRSWLTILQQTKLCTMTNFSSSFVLPSRLLCLSMNWKCFVCSAHTESSHRIFFMLASTHKLHTMSSKWHHLIYIEYDHTAYRTSNIRTFCTWNTFRMKIS